MMVCDDHFKAVVIECARESDRFGAVVQLVHRGQARCAAKGCENYAEFNVWRDDKRGPDGEP